MKLEKITGMMRTKTRFLILETLGMILLLTMLVSISSAFPAYLDSYNTVFNTNSSCSICHVNPVGGGARTSYGMLFENQSNHATNPGASLATIGPSSSHDNNPNIDNYTNTNNTDINNLINSQDKNMTITSDTTFLNVGTSANVTFTVTRPCGSEPSDSCNIAYPSVLPVISAQVSLSESASGSDITNDEGKVTFSINATSIGAVIATVSKEGYTNAMISIPVLSYDIPTPIPDNSTPFPDNSTPIPDNSTPSPNSTTPIPDNSTPVPNSTTPIHDSNCTNDTYPSQTYSSYVGDKTEFGTGNLTSTGKAWYVKWYLNGNEVANESNVTSSSKYVNDGSTAGTWNVSSTATSDCNSKTWTIIWTVSQKPKSGGGGGSSGSGGGSIPSGSSGGGGEGIVSPEPHDNVQRYITKERDIVSKKPVTYSFIDSNFTISEVEVVGNLSDTDVGLRLEHLKGITLTAEKQPAGIIYSNENIWINSRRVASIRIKFKVQNSWIERNNLNKEDIKLLKYYGTNWWKLNTKMVKNDNNYTYYESLSNGQSPYAISGLKEVLKPIDNLNTTNISTNEAAVSIGNMQNETIQNAPISVNPSQNIDNTKELQMVGLATILIILLALGIITRTVVRKLRKA